jgi:thiamine pyrophosphate-dependent acetolactate synthase large subunit-like protein
VQVDVMSPRPMGNGQSADCFIQADAKVVAAALYVSMQDRRPRAIGYRTEASRAALASDPILTGATIADPWEGEGEVDPRILCQRLDELLPDECGVVSGYSGHFWDFPVLHMRKDRAVQIFSTYVGAIGYGLPVGIGAAIAEPGRPFVIFEGDSSLMLGLQSLETAARYGAKVLVVVLNNRALGSEHHKMQRDGLNPYLSLSPDTDIAAVARSLGCRGRRVISLEAVEESVQEFLTGEGPFVLDVLIPMEVTSRVFQKTHLGVV